MSKFLGRKEMLLLAGLIVLIFSVSNAYAQTDIVDNTTNLIIAIGGLAAALGAVVLKLAPWISKVDKRAGEYATTIGSSLIKTDVYAQTVATELKKNKVHIEILEDAVLKLAHVSPELQGEYEKIKAQIAEKEKLVEAQALAAQAELDRINANLPGAATANVEAEKVL